MSLTPDIASIVMDSDDAENVLFTAEGGEDLPAAQPPNP